MVSRLEPVITQAANAYHSATGKNPTDERMIIPYFTTPKDGADYVELLEARKTAGL